MVYDALQYASQVEKAAKSCRKAVKKRSANKGILSKSGKGKEGVKQDASTFKRPVSGEYLSGFRRSDRLLPVITLTILFSSEPWDGPMSIQELSTDKRFRCVERQAAMVINTVTNSGIKFDEGEGDVDLCLAIREMRQESWDEGKKLGEKRGELRGITRINNLNTKLIEAGRLEDLKRASVDPVFQEQLMGELFTEKE